MGEYWPRRSNFFSSCIEQVAKVYGLLHFHSGDTHFHSAGQPSNTSIPETVNDLVDTGEAAADGETAAAISTRG